MTFRVKCMNLKFFTLAGRKPGVGVAPTPNKGKNTLDGIPSGIPPSPKERNNTLIFKVIFGLVILGLIINFVLLWLLNGKVANLREDKDLMAETINRASTIMDKNSGTSYAKELTTESLVNKETFQNALPILTKQATVLAKERDALAKTLASISSLIDTAAQQKESAISDMNSYEQASKAVYDLTKTSLDSNTKLATFFVDIADVIQQNIPDKNEFVAKARTSVDPVLLRSVIEGVTKDKQQVAALTDEISKKDTTITELNNSIKSTSGKDQDITKIFNEQRRELERIKSEHEALKSKIAQSVASSNEDNDEEVQVSNTSAATATAENEVRTIFPEYYYKLKGKVVEYNSKWGFVILDFGSDSKLSLNIDGSQREVTVPAPLGQELYISRGDQFIAKAKIVNVYGKYSVANVIFPTPDLVTKGDSVFFDQPSVNNSTDKKN